jgi:adenylate kinase family enzyme
MNNKRMILIRGIPGSGKTTSAKKIMQENPSFNFKHYETDQWFMASGKYVFDRAKLSEYHKLCQEAVQDSCVNSENVIVSNTFIKRWEMQFYIDCSFRYDYHVRVIIRTGRYPNVHGVPEDVVERMRSNFEY